LGDDSDARHDIQRERLRTAYRAFWTNATVLSREIQRDAPNLTLHDEAHFDALWSAADQIAGPELMLTPLEVFVLGGAILLHDNANSLAAFPGGLEAIRRTPEWQDALVEWAGKSSSEPDLEALSPEASSAVLFEVLRSLHAERALTLAGLSFKNGERIVHLIEDDQLRTHLGDIMGLVAASHHWDVASLGIRLPSIRGALGGMPQAWTVRPVLLACLLRCADATQLDQQRAPDFLYAMLRLRGVSESHWRAQNRLATPVIAPDDPTALIFSSTIPFGPGDSDAWWIAHDAIQVANRELQSSNALLRDQRLPHFAVNRVEGALSPMALSRFVAVSGWRPVQAEIKISQIGKVVEMFGGEELYGHDPSVALRELIQNAADAVRFRQELEPQGSGYEGRITIRLKADEQQPNTHWLDVEDDGLGMSEAVLTGPLIDFGSSYMSSALVKSERPGLLSKGKKRLGRYGIGFFSCFMIADEVLVTSRQFDDGRDKLRTLHFQDGLGHRPLLLDDRPTDFGSVSSTRVRLRLTTDKHKKLLTLQLGGYQNSLPISLSALVGVLCPMLDANVYVEEFGETRLIHSRRWMDEDRLTWLKRITAADVRASQSLDENLASAAPLLTFVDPNQPNLGLACITGMPSAGVATVSTLKASMVFGSPFLDDFVGALDYESEDPRRSRGKPKAGDRLHSWASDQAKLNLEAGIEIPRKLYLAERVANFGGDATPVVMMRLNQEWVDLDSILKHLADVGPLYAPVTYSHSVERQVVITVVRERHTGLLDNYRPGELEFVLPTLQSGSNNSVLYAVPTPDDPAELGFVMLLKRFAGRHGMSIQTDIIERVEFARYVGQASPRDGLEPGKMIGCAGLKIWVELNNLNRP
jgi:hypothetical protein